MISDERLDSVAKMKTHPMALPPNHDECIEMAKELKAYRQAFSEPVAWRHNEGPFGKVATCSQKVGELWVSEGFDVTPLYRKPIIPE